MKKKMFRIELKSMEWHIAKDLAVLAAFSNGQEHKLSINELAAFAKIDNAKLGDSPFTISVVGNTVLIDKGTVNLLCITEIEVMELEMPEITGEEAKTILEEIRNEAPTLSNTGINDTGNFEALN